MRIRKAVFITLMLALAAALLSVTAQAAQDEPITSWKQLQAVISQAGNNDIIYLQQSITADPDDTMLEVTGNKSITLDLN